MIIAWVIMYYSWSIPALFTANALLGVSSGIMEAPINSYVGEIRYVIGTQKPNFVLKNVPRRVNESKEDLIDMVLCLSKDIDCTMTKHDIKDIYRVRGKHSEKLNTPIIVETSSTLLKTDFLKMGKTFNVKHKTKLCCKNLGFKSQENTPIFLSEHLTSKGSRLFFLARDLTKSGCYKFCWTAYGRVLVKKDESSPTITIRNEQQIQQLKMSK